jgi:hypothetical protein
MFELIQRNIFYRILIDDTANTSVKQEIYEIIGILNRADIKIEKLKDFEIDIFMFFLFTDDEGKKSLVFSHDKSLGKKISKMSVMFSRRKFDAKMHISKNYVILNVSSSGSYYNTVLFYKYSVN